MSEKLPCAHCGLKPRLPGSGQRFCSPECREAAKSNHKKPTKEEVRDRAERRRRKRGSTKRPPTWNEAGERWCPFGEHFVHLNTFRQGYCDTCRPLQKKDWKLRAKYGINLAEWNRLYEQQDGKCAICLRPADRLDVDHDHATGRVRGLLCFRCNYTLLGCVQDDADILRRAVTYLVSN